MSMLIDPYRFAVIPSGNTDDFSTNTLPDYTEYADTPADWNIAGGSLNASTANQSILTRNGVSFADGEVSCVISEAEDAGLVLRLTDNNNYYVAVIADGSNPTTPNRVIIFKRVGGGFAGVGSSASIPTFTRGTPTNMSFSAVGNLLTVKVNGVTYISITDSSHASGMCGPRAGSNGAFKMESFSWP